MQLNVHSEKQKKILCSKKCLFMGCQNTMTYSLFLFDFRSKTCYLIPIKKTTKKDRLTFLTKQFKENAKSNMPNKYILLLFFLPKKYFDSPRMSILGEMCINTKKNTKNEWYLTGIKKNNKKRQTNIFDGKKKKICSKSHMPHHTFLLVFF